MGFYCLMIFACIMPLISENLNRYHQEKDGQFRFICDLYIGHYLAQLDPAILSALPPQNKEGIPAQLQPMYICCISILYRDICISVHLYSS